MFEVKVIEIGNSLGFVLPNEVLANLMISKEDRLFLVPDLGGYRIATDDPSEAKQIALVDDIMDRYRNTLKHLAQ